MKLYNSEVKILKLHDIPENGDLMFSLANPSYHSIVVNGDVQIDYTGVDRKISHTPTDKAAIGVDKEGTTMLVEVEGHGVTVAQLANVMVALDAYHAVYTDIAVIKTYELLELEKAQQALGKEVEYEADGEETVVEVETEGVPKTKTKRRK